MTKNKIAKHLILPFQFDEGRLLNDLKIVLKEGWIDHFNVEDYQGKWTSISLYAPGGDETNILAMSKENMHPLAETKIMQKCTYFKDVLAHFKCPLTSVRLLNLGAGAHIKPHTDYNLGYENDCFRLHIPIVTNSRVKFILDDILLIMLPGECWYTNVNYTHSVSNEGDIDRIHLIIDGERNAWSDDLFFSLTPKERLLPEYIRAYDAETTSQIIHELNLRKPEGYADLILELKNNIKID